MDEVLAQLRQEIENEQLEYHNLFERNYWGAYEVGMVHLGENFVVYATDERANARYEESYSELTEAASVFIEKLRRMNDKFRFSREIAQAETDSRHM